jgi:hypothetical protein
MSRIALPSGAGSLIARDRTFNLAIEEAPSEC